MLIHVESWEVQIGPTTGAVIIYPQFKSEPYHLFAVRGPHGRKYHSDPGDYIAHVVSRKGPGGEILKAIFPAVEPGLYRMYRGNNTGLHGTIQVIAGQVTEKDERW